VQRVGPEKKKKRRGKQTVGSRSTGLNGRMLRKQAGGKRGSGKNEHGKKKKNGEGTLKTTKSTKTDSRGPEREPGTTKISTGRPPKSGGRKKWKRGEKQKWKNLKGKRIGKGTRVPA